MASRQELQVQQKRELEKKEETTIPARVFLPTADIYETNDALNVILEMPGSTRTASKSGLKTGFSRSTGDWISRNTKGCSRSIPSTTSATIRAASGFRARSTKTTSELN
jgi:hypothetical protein